MQKPVVIMGRTLSLSDANPVSLTFTLDPLGTVDGPALRTTGKGGQPVLIDKIVVAVKATGDYVVGTSTFVGSGSDSIVASTPRVMCEGKQMLTEGDKVVITCTGTVTLTSNGSTSTNTAKVTATITDGVQKNVNANKA